MSEKSLKNTIYPLLRRIALLLLVSYVGFLVLLYSLQRDIIFQPGQDNRTPEAIGLAGYEVIPLRAADGIRGHGWYHAPADGAPTILFFHGNAGTLVNRAEFLRLVAERGFGVLAVEYRGYAGLEGKPTEEGLYRDARAAVQWLIQRGANTQQIIFYGRSLGTGVAVQMAMEYDGKALVLVSPYTSIADVAQGQYWFLPVRFLVLDPFDSYAKIPLIHEPVILFHGDQDEIIPYWMGEKLLAGVSGEKHLHALRGQGHDNLDTVFIVDWLAARHHLR